MIRKSLMLLYALVAYVLATPFEEADLVDALGKPYLDYQKRVPKFVPFSKK